MKIKNNTEYGFFSKIVEDALTKCGLTSNGKPIENAEIIRFDTRCIIFTIEGASMLFAVDAYEVKPVAGNKLKIKYALFMQASENCMTMDEITIEKPPVNPFKI